MIDFIDLQWAETLLRFIGNSVFVFAMIRGIYYPISRRKDFSFTYLLISTIIFFLVSLLGKANIGIGFAFGMFAIFGIIRYRTLAFPIKEMTYLFVVIGMAVVNAMSLPDMPVISVLLANVFVLVLAYTLEHRWFAKGESVKYIKYEKVELIVPEKRAELLEDLSLRTGLNIKRIEIGDINFLRDVVLIKVYFLGDDHPGHSRGDFRFDA